MEQSIIKDLDEKKEMVIQCYRKTYDKNVAYTKCSLTAEEILLLDSDKDFQARLNYVLAEQKEFIIGRLTTLCSSSDKDEVALKATIKLGEIIYSEVFSATEDDKAAKLILPVETQKKLKDIFTSGTLEAWKQKVQEKLLVTEEESPQETIDKIVN
jgi:hypothetical protein